MSWSHNFTGEALEVARKVEKESEYVQKYLSNHAEKAIHARITSLIVVACHEQKGSHVKVEASGHFDGSHQHFRVAVDGIETPAVGETVDETLTDVPATPVPAVDLPKKSKKGDPKS